MRDWLILGALATYIVLGFSAVVYVHGFPWEPVNPRPLSTLWSD